MTPRCSTIFHVAASLLLAVGCAPEPTKPTASPAGTGSAQRALNIAAASDLKFAFEEIKLAFEREYPDTRLKVTYGSSGNFFSQIIEGAPFEMFLSANSAYPRQLIERGLADQGSDFQYGTGRIVVWTPAGSKLDVEKLKMETVVEPSVRKVAIANPRHAPYGQAAEAALQKYGVYERTKDRLVLGENIAQTLQFVESGAADVGIVALPLVIAPAVRDRGRFWRVPADAHAPLEQRGIILKSAREIQAAHRLRDFMIAGAGRGILRDFGLAGE